MSPGFEKLWVVEFHPEFSRDVLGFRQARNLLARRIAQNERTATWQASGRYAQGIEALEYEGASLPRG